MKTKPLLMFFVFILTLTSTCLFAQPAKDTAKPAKSVPPSIIKKIDIPCPVSAAVDEKENRVFVMSAADENSAVFVLNGMDNSIIKKIPLKEHLYKSVAGNGMGYDPETKRIYAIAGKNGRLLVVIDIKTYKMLDVIKNPRNYTMTSVNITERGNKAYIASMGYPYIFVFNGGNNRFEDEIKVVEGDMHHSSISKDDNLLYIVESDKFFKYDIKTKMVAALLPHFFFSLPIIDERKGLIYIGSAYKLYVIDLKTFKVKDEREDVPFSNTDGASLALNPSTNHLFVPTYGDSVSVIDVSSMKMLATIKVGQTVKSIAVNSRTNRVYVTLVNYENKVIVIQDR